MGSSPKRIMGLFCGPILLAFDARYLSLGIYLASKLESLGIFVPWHLSFLVMLSTQRYAVLA